MLTLNASDPIQVATMQKLAEAGEYSRRCKQYDASLYKLTVRQGAYRQRPISDELRRELAGAKGRKL